MSNRRTSGGRPTAGAENRNSGGGGGAGVLTINGNGNAAQTIAGASNSGLVATSVGGSTSLSQVIAAEWPTTTVRIYAVDFVNGLDTNAGFADPAGTSAAQYAAACAAAGLVAKKTLLGLAAIFPRYGAGRNVEVVIANGGVNTAQAYADALDVFQNGVGGYNSYLIRTTGTNPTAGCTAFDGSIADITYQGGITVTGLNVAGYNPVGATTTNLPMQLNGGGAAALPAEPAAPLGWRVRFDAATTTVALRNQCRQIAQVLTGNTIIPQTAFTAAPANADVFYIEQAGVTVPASVLSYPVGPNVLTSAHNVMGIRCTGALNIGNALVRMAFCGAASLNSLGFDQITFAQTLNHFVLGLVTVGGGMRSEGAVSINQGGGGSATCVGLVGATSITFFQQNATLNFAAGCFAGTVLNYQSVQNAPGLTIATGLNFGITGALAAPRAQRLAITATNMQLGGGVLAGAGANPAITVVGVCVLSFSQGIVSGSVGNNDVGLDLTNAQGTLIECNSTPTVTGALGDVRLAGGQIVSWAALLRTGIIDINGNVICFAGAAPLGKLQFTGAIFGAAGATISYCANAGFTTIIANEVIAFRRPTSLRYLTRLRVNVVGDTSVNAVTVTVYKNGAPAAPLLQVSIPAGTAANTKFVANANVLFADTDDMDLRLDDGAADAGGIVRISAALEYPL